MDTKDKTIYFLTMLVMVQVIFNIMLVGWHYHEVEEIRETAEFAKSLALDSYNSNIYAQNYNVELKRDIWDLQGYLNHTMGYWPYYPYVTTPYAESDNT